MNLFFRPSFGKINFRISRFALVRYLLAAALIAAVYFQPFVPVGQLTRDTISVNKGKFYDGLVSNFGLFLWTSTAAVCFFTYSVIRKTASRRQQWFVLFGFIMSAVLLLDDYLLLHELVFPVYLGLNEIWIMALYPLLIIFFLVYFLPEILASQVLLLGSALGCLGFSEVSDQIFTEHGSIIIVEDGFKFLGIVGWFSYFFQVCSDTIGRHAFNRRTFEGANKKYTPLLRAINRREEVKEEV